MVQHVAAVRANRSQSARCFPVPRLPPILQRNARRRPEPVECEYPSANQHHRACTARTPWRYHQSSEPLADESTGSVADIDQLRADHQPDRIPEPVLPNSGTVAVLIRGAKTRMSFSKTDRRAW